MTRPAGGTWLMTLSGWDGERKSPLSNNKLICENSPFRKWKAIRDQLVAIATRGLTEPVHCFLSCLFTAWIYRFILGSLSANNTHRNCFILRHVNIMTSTIDGGCRTLMIFASSHRLRLFSFGSENEREKRKIRLPSASEARERWLWRPYWFPD